MFCGDIELEYIYKSCRWPCVTSDDRFNAFFKTCAYMKPTSRSTWKWWTYRCALIFLLQLLCKIISKVRLFTFHTLIFLKRLTNQVVFVRKMWLKETHLVVKMMLSFVYIHQLLYIFHNQFLSANQLLFYQHGLGTKWEAVLQDSGGPCGGAVTHRVYPNSGRSMPEVWQYLPPSSRSLHLTERQVRPLCTLQTI